MFCSIGCDGIGGGLCNRHRTTNGGLYAFSVLVSGLPDYALVGSYYCDGTQPSAKRHRMARPVEPPESREEAAR